VTDKYRVLTKKKKQFTIEVTMFIGGFTYGEAKTRQNKRKIWSKVDGDFDSISSAFGSVHHHHLFLGMDDEGWISKGGIVGS
jgi:hypothetical protein